MQKRGVWLLWSVGAQVSTGVAGLLTNVVYARQLTLAGVGEVALANAVAILVAVALDRGVGSWMTANLARHPLSSDQALAFAWRGARLAFGAYLAVAGILSVAVSDTLVGRVAAVSIPLTLCYWLFQVALSYQQGHNRPYARAGSISANGILTLVATTAALQWRATTTVAILASAVAYGAVAVLTFRPSRRPRRVDGTWSGERQAVALREARPLFGANVATFAVSSGDVILATLTLSTSAVGQYQIARKVAQAGVLPFSTMLPMLLGRIAGVSGPRRRQIILQFGVGFTLIFVAAAAVGTVLLKPALGLAFGSALKPVAGTVIVLALAYSLMLLRDLLGTLRTADGDYRGPLTVNVLVAVALCVGVAVSAPWASLLLFSVVLTVAFGLGVVAHLLGLRTASNWSGRETRVMLAMGAAMILVAVVTASTLDHT